METVILYSMSRCRHCDSVKKLLEELGVAYECREPDSAVRGGATSLFEELKKVNEKCSFPTVVIGRRVIVGFREREIKEALGP